MKTMKRVATILITVAMLMSANFMNVFAVTTTITLMNFSQKALLVVDQSDYNSWMTHDEFVSFVGKSIFGLSDITYKSGKVKTVLNQLMELQMLETKEVSGKYVFADANLISRQHSLMSVNRMFEFTGLESKSLFTDDSEVNDKYRQSVYLAKELGIVKPDKNGKLTPYKAVDIAFAKTVVNNLIAILQQSKIKISVPLATPKYTVTVRAICESEQIGFFSKQFNFGDGEKLSLPSFGDYEATSSSLKITDCRSSRTIDVSYGKVASSRSNDHSSNSSNSNGSSSGGGGSIPSQPDLPVPPQPPTPPDNQQSKPEKPADGNISQPEVPSQPDLPVPPQPPTPPDNQQSKPEKPADGNISQPEVPSQPDLPVPPQPPTPPDNQQSKPEKPADGNISQPEVLSEPESFSPPPSPQPPTPPDNQQFKPEKPVD